MRGPSWHDVFRKASLDTLTPLPYPDAYSDLLSATSPTLPLTPFLFPGPPTPPEMPSFPVHAFSKEVGLTPLKGSLLNLPPRVPDSVGLGRGLENLHFSGEPRGVWPGDHTLKTTEVPSAWL